MHAFLLFVMVSMEVTSLEGMEEGSVDQTLSSADRRGYTTVDILLYNERPHLHANYMPKN